MNSHVPRFHPPIFAPYCKAENSWGVETNETMHEAMDCVTMHVKKVGLTTAISTSHQIPHDSAFPKSSWIPVVELEYEGPVVKTQGTQTQGIFYPSARTITGSKGAESTSKAIRVVSRDHLPKLDTYSPGKGETDMAHVNKFQAKPTTYMYMSFLRQKATRRL